MKLWLDDIRPAPKGWEWVKSFHEFKSWVDAHGVPEEVSFDHDLGLEHYDADWQNLNRKIEYDAMKEKSGLHCARYLDERGTPKVVHVHSWNVAGARNIADVFHGKCEVIVKPAS